MNRFRFFIVVFTFLVGPPIVLAQEPTPAEPSTTYTFDGIVLGTQIPDIMQRAPFDAPCDDDPLRAEGLRVVVYAAFECRERTFPDSTNVVLYYPDSRVGERPDRPLRAIAWVGGTYFNTRTNFPLRPGVAIRETMRGLGTANREFDIGDEDARLRVHAFPSNVYVLSRRGRVVGFVVGTMPENAELESWTMLARIHQRAATPRRR